MLEPSYCKHCGKEFYPTPDHVYKDDDGIYCGWNCLTQHRNSNKAHCKQVQLMDPNDPGTPLYTYKNARYAASVFRGSEVDIRRACKTGERCYGYHWRYADDNTKKGEK